MCTIRVGDRHPARRALGALALLGLGALGALAPNHAMAAPASGPAGPAIEQPATVSASTAALSTRKPATSPARAKGEAEFLIPPGGGVIDVPVHVGAICIFSFPEKLVAKGIVSSPDFEVQTWGPENVAVRASAGATTATVALTTASGKVKINATLRVVAEDEPAYTLVRLTPASEEEAFQARVDAEVATRLALLQEQVAALRRSQETKARALADQAAAAGALHCSDVRPLDARERSDAHVIVHVTKALVLGDSVYVLFDVENRSKAPFRVAAVKLYGKRGAALATVPYLFAAPDLRNPRTKALGVAVKGAKLMGAAVVPFAELARDGRFSLEVVEVDPRQSIEVGDLTL